MSGCDGRATQERKSVEASVTPIIFRYGWIPWLAAALIALIFFRKKRKGPFYVKLLLGLAAAWFALSIVLLSATRPRVMMAAHLLDDSSSEKRAACVFERGGRTYLLITEPGTSQQIRLYLGGSLFGGKSYKNPEALVWLEEGRKLAVLFDRRHVLVVPMPEGKFPDKRFIQKNARYARGEELEKILREAKW